jgi:hypothetical protein
MILAAFERALAEGRADVAEHLLCALEADEACCAPGAPLARAYLSAAGPAAADGAPPRSAARRRAPASRVAARVPGTTGS